MIGSDTTRESDRGQAYTLEGFISAMVVLMAVLFALQSVVIMPTTGGTADRTVQHQLQQEAKDALVVAAQDGDLSETIRKWDPDGDWLEEEVEGDGEPAFYKADQPGPDGTWTYSTETFADESVLGSILKSRFADQGWSYNVELVSADTEGGFETTRMVYQGSAPPDAFTASYTVTLYEDEVLMPSKAEEEEIEEIRLEDASDHEYPISHKENGDSPVYNVVEVRVTVW